MSMHQPCQQNTLNFYGSRKITCHADASFTTSQSPAMPRRSGLGLGRSGYRRDRRRVASPAWSLLFALFMTPFIPQFLFGLAFEFILFWVDNTPMTATYLSKMWRRTPCILSCFEIVQNVAHSPVFRVTSTITIFASAGRLWHLLL